MLHGIDLTECRVNEDWLQNFTDVTKWGIAQNLSLQSDLSTWNLTLSEETSIHKK